ncbi:MAG: hypothetical protein AAFP13_04220 [Pseudomonadota bacterium]
MTKTLIAATLAGLLSAGTASAVTLDFDGAGVAISGTAGTGWFITDDAVTWEIIPSIGRSGGDGPMLFDTTCTGYTADCNGDPDLRVVNQANPFGVSGNVLVQDRDNPGPTPNDDLFTYDITLKLVSDVSLVWTGFSAVDDGEYTASFKGNQLGQIVMTGENELGRATFLSERIVRGDSIFIDFNGETGSPDYASGGVDNLTFAAVPLPASVLLLFGALGGLFALGRRRGTA